MKQTKISRAEFVKAYLFVPLLVLILIYGYIYEKWDKFWNEPVIKIK